MAGDWTADFATANANADLLNVSDRKRMVAATYFQTDVSALATQASVTALGSPMQAGSYVAPDNATIATIESKVDALGSPMQAGSYVAPDNATIAAIDGKVDALGSPMQASAYVAPDNATIAAIDGKADAIIADIYALTHNEAGEPIQRVIPLPESAEACVLYEYCFDPSSQSPLASVTATALISALPYDYGGKLHTGAIIAGTYDAAEGLVSWEIVQGATVTVSIKEVGVLSRITIPAAPQARVFDLLTP